MMAGTYEPTWNSLRNLVYAKLISDSEDGVSYEAPKPLLWAISTSITPSTNTEKLHADDNVADIMNALGDIALELELAALPLKTQADLLGHSYVNGTMIQKATDDPPYVAVGFMSKERGDSRIRFVWLYKGKFKLVEDSYASAADKPEWKKPKISATFVKRIYDDLWQIIADSSDPDFKGAKTWFDEVQMPPALPEGTEPDEPEEP